MIIKLAFMEDIRAFLRSPSGRSTAIGAALGATAGAIHRKDNRTHGAMTGGMIGGLAGLASHETGLNDAIKAKFSKVKRMR